MRILFLTLSLYSLVSFPVYASGALTVYKDANCGCCAKWVEHMKLGGYTVNVVNQDPSSLQSTKDRLNVPSNKRSCHTAVLGNYVFEGHIPVDVVNRYLKSGAKGFGLAVPGMPLGSPGMEFGDRKHKYMIYELNTNNSENVFHTIDPKA